MKILYTIFVLLLIASLLYAQDTNPQNPFSGVEIGSNNFYRIQMNNGAVLKARIVSVDPEKVLLLLPGGESMTVVTSGVVSIKKQSYGSVGSVGIGFGIPYGMLGVNFDLKLFSVLYANAGIGTGIFVTPMYSGGLKCYFLSGGHKFRPRILANYGTTGMLYLEDEYGDVIERSSFHSLCFGTGFQYALDISKAFAFDFDMIYIVSNNALLERAQELRNQGYEFDLLKTGHIKVSVGIRYIF
jgi:hypothetical protein